MPQMAVVAAATQADRRASERRSAPTWKPTRIVAATPRDSGTMKATPTMLNAT